MYNSVSVRVSVCLYQRLFLSGPGIECRRVWPNSNYHKVQSSLSSPEARFCCQLQRGIKEDEIKEIFLFRWSIINEVIKKIYLNKVESIIN